MRKEGLEPSRPKAQEPKSCVSADFTTPAGAASVYRRASLDPLAAERPRAYDARMDASEPQSGTTETGTTHDRALCPLCAHPMSEHRIDHSGRDGILHCPVDHLPEPDDRRPLNELGMTRSD